MSKAALPVVLPLWLAVVASPQVMALGLGEAELDSYLGRPLVARIPVFSAQNLDAEQLNVRLLNVVDAASDSALSNLESSKIVVRKEIDANGRGVIYLQSQVPLNEPFLNFILQVRWPAGSLQREYTLLLDLPPVLPASAAGAAQSSTSGVLAAQRSKTAAVRPATRSAPETTPIVQDSDSYITVRGDTLWSIAGSLKNLRGGDRTALMAQIFALNPQAFIRGDRNLLKERVRLDINAARLAAATMSPVEPLQIEQVDTPVSVMSEPVEEGSEAVSSGQHQATAAAETRLVDTGESTIPEDTESRLLVVGREIQAVANNIDDMTARLALLEERLARLQEQYAQMEAGADSLAPASLANLLDEMQIPAVTVSEQGSTAGVVESAAIASGENDTGSKDSAPPAGAENRLNNTAVSEGRGWFFGLLFIAVAGLLWFLRRRERGTDQVLPVTRGPAMRPAEGDDFEEVFTGLSHSWSTPVAAEDAPKPETPQNPVQPDSGAQVDQASVADDVVMAGLSSVEAANDDDEPADQVAEVSETEELFIDDDLDLSAFEEEELDLENLLGSAEQREDEQWASSELRTQAAACVKMDDWTGAQRLFEKALAADEDNVELKMELLDVYAHLGDVASFESLALQMEFGGVNNRILNEIELLRNTLHEQENRLGTKATDFRGK